MNISRRNEEVVKMNAYKLPDYHGNFYMIESAASEEVFADILYNFCSDKYSTYSGNYNNEELHFEILEKLVLELESAGFTSRLIRPISEHHIWVWD